ncbi:phage recombination protein Bet [Ferrovibrio terrae]|uniref:phage recombination protein Bet n=1 Tax=Ferrovibrio terrae TaxID=2594003 RepID=UPI003137A85E
MNQVIAMAPRDYNGSQLALIQKTVAKNCNTGEFDLFMEVCRRVKLDPFRKQIHAVVYSKDNADKRKMSIITGIDGFRAVAARCGDYRPDDQEPELSYDEAEKSPANPLGLVKAVVRCFKLGPDKQWHPVVGVAYWNEFAPIKTKGTSNDDYDWIETGETWPDSGKPKKRKQLKPGAVEVQYVDGNWASMPRVMIAKCAEAQALRKGWPEDLSGIYAAEEMDRVRAEELSASEMVEQHQQDNRLKLVSAKDSVPLIFEAGASVEMVPLGKVADRILAFLEASQSPTQIDAFRETNRAGLQTYWALNKSEALEIKTAIENRIKELEAA